MTSIIAHVATFVAVTTGLFLGWWFLWVPVLVWYAVYTNGWWVVLIAILVDGYYGAFYTVPYQALLAFVIVSAMECLRPYLFTRP